MTRRSSKSSKKRQTVTAKRYPLTPEQEARFQRHERARRLEAQRLKERLSSIPFYANRAKKYGETYWSELAQSYQGEA